MPALLQPLLRLATINRMIAEQKERPFSMLLRVKRRTKTNQVIRCA